MRCPECNEAGLTSTVTQGPVSSTLAYSAPFYDEKGKHHHHDPNKKSTIYSCSNGHRWGEEWVDECWCGWPNRETKEELYEGVRRIVLEDEIKTAEIIKQMGGGKTNEDIDLVIRYLKVRLDDGNSGRVPSKFMLTPA